MLINSLVSLIAPCYNGEQYLERFLNSLLNQTYTNIQFIFVDDGSTDNTLCIANKYKADLESKFSEVIYIQQKNGGAGSAVNNALKYVKGEFLAWADCDDVLHMENIEMKLKYLLEHQEFGLVLCGARVIDEDSNECIEKRVLPKGQQVKNIFEKIIFSGIPCYSGVAMIRTKLLLDKLGEERTIFFDAEVGQNWQLLLPVAYDHSCGYLQTCLYDYYIRADSHSHQNEYNKIMQRSYAQENVLHHILDFVDKENKENLFHKIALKYIYERMNISFYAMKSEDFFENYKRVYILEKNVHFKWKVKALILRNRLIRYIYLIWKRTRKLPVYFK